MEQAHRLHVFEKAVHLSLIEEVAGVPLPVSRRFVWRRSVVKRMNLEIPAHERRKNLPPDKAGGSGDNYPVHNLKSGAKRSRSERMISPDGQVIPNDGSFQRIVA